MSHIKRDSIAEIIGSMPIKRTAKMQDACITTLVFIIIRMFRSKENVYIVRVWPIEKLMRIDL